MFKCVFLQEVGVFGVSNSSNHHVPREPVYGSMKEDA